MNPPAAPTLLRWTRFAGAPFGTGGDKRSAQIRALCTAGGFGIEDMRPPPNVPRWRARLAGGWLRWRLGRHASVDGAGPGLLGYRAVFYRDALARHRGIPLLLWETTYDSILPMLARRAGYRIIALPHNLESLVSEAAFGDSRHDVLAGLAAEIGRLQLADAVFTISKEERWLLEARGLEPHYLPFYPDPVLAEGCRRIHGARTASARPDGSVAGPLLLVGSAFNPATERGMRWQLAQLHEAGGHSPEVVVVGSQTDTRLADLARPGVTLLGGVAWEKLAELLTACTAVLIHTVGGAGAVTRIAEALVAGVPVIANGNAARDQYGTPGVHVYEDPAGFQALVQVPLPLPPLPSPPASAEARFHSELRHLSANAGA